MARSFYISTPIYYVNDRPHIGHSYTTVIADAITRFQRIAGREAFFLTGTDEHGAKIAEAAADAGKEPQEFCDEIVKHFKSAWQTLDIEESDFIRTTDQRHLNGVTKILTLMKEARTPDGQDVLYRATYEGLYCTGCERYYTEKELVDGLCPFHKTKPELVKENNWFFRLTSYLPEIKRLIETEEMLILPLERRRETLSLIEQGLQDFSMTREKVKWGIPTPFDPEQSAYVWVDALSNYITAIGFADDERLYEKWWTRSETVHLMAKDILKFHCLFWPAMLMSIGAKLPEQLFLHGFFTVDGEKMSKSLGNMIDPRDMVTQYGSDGSRYLLVTQVPFGVDGDVQASRFTEKYNSDLANDLGNLVSRVVKMIERDFEGRLPPPQGGLIGTQQLLDVAEDAADQAYGEVKHFRLHGAIEVTRKLIKETNRFFDSNSPWKLSKENKRAEQGGVLYNCAEALRIIAILLYPVMPSKMRELRTRFALTDETLTLDAAREFFWLKPGSPVHAGEPLFPRLQKAFVSSNVTTSKEKEQAQTVQANGLLDISEFGRLNLRVAEVTGAEKVEGADKLLRLQVSLGDEERQIVAGVAQHYSPDEIVGQKIVVVTNLKPAVIRGVESQGMLLAATKGKKLTLVSPSGDISVGAKVS
ncbi:MAG: methionine--tRNA ligase [Candidatus Zixiibacteriota bacterium]